MRHNFELTHETRARNEFSELTAEAAVPRVAVLAAGMGVALVTLLGALFWTQVARGGHYGESLEEQTVRRIRVPALRGGLYDRNGLLLVTNRPSYNIVLYVEELQHLRKTVRLSPSAAQYAQELRRLKKDAMVVQMAPVVRETIDRIAQRLGAPMPVTDAEIERHVKETLPLPMTLWKNVEPQVAAAFAEKCSGMPGADLEVTPVRRALYGPLAAHTLGYVQQTAYRLGESRREFNFYLSDMEGKDGIERQFDEHLRGRAGAHSMLIDASGFRRGDLASEPMQPGKNLVLTLDAGIQHMVEQVLASDDAHGSPGACVLIDPRSGDVLALANLPSYDPNLFSSIVTRSRWEQLRTAPTKPLLNRATSEHYAPGSAFKIVVSLAGLETGAITPESHSTCHGVFSFPNGFLKHCWQHSGHGEMDFSDAFKHSCDVFFYEHGLATGPNAITAMAQQFGLGQPTEITLLTEAIGIVPGTTQEGWRNWYAGDTANYAIGQGRLTVTPLQMALVTAAVANGGKVMWPRLVQRVEQADETGKTVGVEETFAPRVRRELSVSPRSLELVRRAMLRVVEESDGTGHLAGVSGVKIAGKTGTAEFTSRGKTVKRVWFVAFAPYDEPRYALALILENGDSGGHTAAPLAGKIFAELFGVKTARAQEGGGRETTGD